jgi:hypothetical protein
MLELNLHNWWIWYKRVWAAIYLILRDTWFSETYLWKSKNLHDEILHDKVWIPTRAKMNIFSLGKLSHLCYFYFIEFSQTLLYVLWEVCHTLKIKITLHTSHSPLYFVSPKMFFSYTGRKHQNILFRFSSYKCSNYFVLSLKYFI